MSTVNDAALLCIDLGRCSSEEDQQEFVNLVSASGAVVRKTFHIKRSKPNPRYFIGVGKAQEISRYAEDNDVRLLIANQNLSPSQERNLEQLCKARVLSYSGLILDIFAQRARSHEGKLQVELAQLVYLSTRLVRGWSHLERQKGGIGLRGPGEKQLETDRRLVRERIRRIERSLEKMEHQRQLGRRRRQKNGVVTVALVGYTNAGKSTLFNSLTSEHTYAADMPFATLDTLMRCAYLDGIGSVIFSDTVGFIRDLPPTLVDAFNATLLEIREADMLLNVVDIANDNYAEQCYQVNKVLAAIGADALPRLTAYNKIDSVGGETSVRRDADGMPTAVFLSAETGDGLKLLRAALRVRLEALTMDKRPAALTRTA